MNGFWLDGIGSELLAGELGCKGHGCCCCGSRTGGFESFNVSIAWNWDRRAYVGAQTISQKQCLYCELKTG